MTPIEIKKIISPFKNLEDFKILKIFFGDQIFAIHSMYLEFFNEYQIQSWVKIHEIDNQFKHEENEYVNSKRIISSNVEIQNVEYPNIENGLDIKENVFNFQKYFDENSPCESYSKLKKRNAYPKKITNLERKNLASKDKLVRMKIKKIVEFFESNISEPSIFEQCISDIEKYMQDNQMILNKYNDEIIYYVKLFENWKKFKNL